MKDKKWSKPIEGEWASTLQSYINTLTDKVPSEWKTTPEVMECFGLKYTRGGGRHMMLADMCKRGILETRKFKVTDASGRRVLSISHYRLVKKLPLPRNKAVRNRKTSANSN